YRGRLSHAGRGVFWLARFAPPPGQYAAERRHKDGDCGGLFAFDQIQGVLGPDPGRTRRQAWITPRNQGFSAISDEPGVAWLGFKCHDFSEMPRHALRSPQFCVFRTALFQRSPDTMATQPAPAAAKPKVNTVSLKHLAAALAGD